MPQNICPKCKKPISENDIRCPHCNMRLKQICPVCGTANHFGVEKCVTCEKILIKYCENCGSANLSSAKECRKCGTELIVEETVKEEFLRTIKTPQGRPQSNTVLSTSPIQPAAASAHVEEVPVVNEEPVQQGLIDDTDYSEEENIISEKIATEEEPLVNTQEQEPQLDLDEYDEYSDGYVEEEDAQEIVSFADSQSLTEQLANIMQNPNNAVVVAVCGEEGMGKTTLLKNFSDSLGEQGILTICSENSELIKVSPFGCIRDALLKLLTLPDIHPNINGFYEETKPLFEQNFPDLTDTEILNFMNFLYPISKSDFEHLTENKTSTYALLEKIFTSITQKNNSVFIIDNFDLIDVASFEFIQYLIKKSIIDNKTKAFISYKECRPAKLYFDRAIAKQNIFATLQLQNMDENATIELIKSFSNAEQVPTAVSFAVNEKGRGNIFFTEQFLSLLFDAGYMFISSNAMKFKDDEPIPYLPKNMEEVIRLRYSLMEQQTFKDCLMTASIMGYKFDKSAFMSVLGVEEDMLNQILQNLTDLMFIQPVSDYEYAFKNLTAWSVIFEEAHKDAKFKMICKKIYYVFSQYAQSNPTLKSTIAQYCDEAETTMQSWKETAGISAYLGDETIYELALEQILALTGYSEDSSDLNDFQLELFEKIAKIVYKTKPSKAVKYLIYPITTAKQNEDNIKLIDLCGYLIKACYLTSDYKGVIETVDLILQSADTELEPLDKAIISSKKLNALFKSGNCEEGLNLANNDIIPKLEEALSAENNPELAQNLFNAWFETSVNMINLYALQGNSKALEIADNTAEIMQMNDIKNPECTVKLNLAKAFALTVIGRIKESESLLSATARIPEYHNKTNLSFGNLITMFNHLLSGNKENLREQLYEYAQFAENANDNISKHFYKLVLAWLTGEEGGYTQANIIFNEELSYFADEKIVTGALISWMFMAVNSLKAGDTENAEHVAMKALEIAQNPKFSQYHIAIYLQQLISEINLMKGDAVAAKMYLEKGMLIAKQFGLDLAQINLYCSYVQFLLMSTQQPNVNKSECAEKANKIYQAALVSAQKLNLQKLQEEIIAEQEQLTEFCQTNGITLQ